MAGTAAIPWLIGRAIDAIDAGDRSRTRVAGRRNRRRGPAAPRLLGRAPDRLRHVSLGVEYDLRNGLYAHLQALELGFFDRQQTGQLMSRATVDLQSIRFFLGYGLVWITQSGMTILFAAVAMFALDPALAALALAPVPFVVVIAARYGSRSRPALQEVQQRIAELTAEAEENVSGVRVVKAFAAEPRQLERFRHQVRRVFEQAMFSTRLSAFYQPFIGFLPQLGLAAILIVGGRQVINGTLTAGDFAAFYTYLLMLIAPMRSLGIALGFAQRATASGVRLFELLDREPRLASPDRRAAAARSATGASSCATCRSATRTGRRSCGDIDLTVEGGTTVALVGATGSGKSSLVSLLARNYDVTRRRGAGRRRRRPRRRAQLAAQPDRRRHRRPVPVQRHRPRQHRLRAAGGDARGRRAGGGARAGGGLHRRAARGLRHGRRRARADAVRRPAPADRDRASAADRPAHPRARRRHLVGRRLDRAGDQAGAARGDARAARRS